MSTSGSNLILGLNPLIGSLEGNMFSYNYCLKNRGLYFEGTVDVYFKWHFLITMVPFKHLSDQG